MTKYTRKQLSVEAMRFPGKPVTFGPGDCVSIHAFEDWMRRNDIKFHYSDHMDLFVWDPNGDGNRRVMRKDYVVKHENGNVESWCDEHFEENFEEAKPEAEWRGEEVVTASQSISERHQSYCEGWDAATKAKTASYHIIIDSLKAEHLEEIRELKAKFEENARAMSQSYTETSNKLVHDYEKKLLDEHERGFKHGLKIGQKHVQDRENTSYHKGHSDGYKKGVDDSEAKNQELYKQDRSGWKFCPKPSPIDSIYHIGDLTARYVINGTQTYNWQQVLDNVENALSKIDEVLEKLITGVETPCKEPPKDRYLDR